MVDLTDIDEHESHSARMLCGFMCGILALIILVFAGSPTITRYATFTENVCLKYGDCPYDPNSNGHRNGNGDDIYGSCVILKDMNGMTYTGIQPDADINPVTTNNQCWSDGYEVTLTDPKVVMQVIAYIILSLSIIFFLCTICGTICLIGQYGPIILKKVSGYISIVLIILDTIFLFIWGIIMLILLVDRRNKAVEVSCTGYTSCLSDMRTPSLQANNFATCIKYTRTLTNTTFYNDASGLFASSYRPDTLPQKCWLTSSNLILFNDPNVTLLYLGYTTLIVLIISILFGIISCCIRDETNLTVSDANELDRIRRSRTNENMSPGTSVMYQV
jgi:hypothetical protein